MPRGGFLFVIEAPGKLARLRQLAYEYGLDDVEVAATAGHIFSNPHKLAPLGILPDWSEPLRAPIFPARAAAIAQAAEGRRVLVMTDDDAEGDVIAYDIYRLVRKNAMQIARAPLHGLTLDQVGASLRSAVPMPAAEWKERAAPGRARAIIDRLIGATFSGYGVAAGRVSSAILGLVNNGEAKAGEAVLRLGAADGGADYVATVPCRSAEEARLLIKAAAEAPPAQLGERVRDAPAPTPMNMGEILMEAERRLGLTPDQANEHMQKAYEEGRMSYPRAAVKAVGREGLAKVAMMARDAGVRFDAHRSAKLPKGRDAGTAGGNSHEAPHPLEHLDLRADPAQLDPQTALLTMIGRRLVQTGQPRSVDIAAPTGLPPVLAGISFERHVGWPAPGKGEDRAAGWYEYSPQAMVLDLMLRHDIGRPSTWPTHAALFAGRDLMNTQDASLTSKGEHWLRHQPAALLEPDTTRGIETLLSNGTPSPSAATSTTGRDDAGGGTGGGNAGQEAEAMEPWRALVRAAIATLPRQMQAEIMRRISEHRSLLPEGTAEGFEPLDVVIEITEMRPSADADTAPTAQPADHRTAEELMDALMGDLPQRPSIGAAADAPRAPDRGADDEDALYDLSA